VSVPQLVLALQLRPGLAPVGSPTG
jgi:hypothetical protein